MSDLLSKQAAIDIERNATVDTIERQAAIDALRDAENHAFNSYYQGLKKAHKIIADLPSAQPEIIYCKDCKWKQGAECVRFADVRPFPSDFCSRAERQEDERPET